MNRLFINFFIALVLSLTACAEKTELVNTSATNRADKSGEVTDSGADIDDAATVGQSGARDNEETSLKVPKLTYKMAPIYVSSEPDEFGQTQSNYIIELNEPGFNFSKAETKLIDKSTGQECGYDSGYDLEIHIGCICIEERSHYGQRSEGFFYPWETDRMTMILMIQHKGEGLAQEDIRVVADIYYADEEIQTRVFEVNADLSEITVNSSLVIHGESMVKLDDEYYMIDANAPINSSENNYITGIGSIGIGFRFVHLSGGEMNSMLLENYFKPMKWDKTSFSFVPFDASPEYDNWKKIDNDNGNIIVKMGVSGPLSKMEEEGISYEILEELVPTYESSTAKMIFNWGY